MAPIPISPHLPTENTPYATVSSVSATRSQRPKMDPTAIFAGLSPAEQAELLSRHFATQARRLRGAAAGGGAAASPLYRTYALGGRSSDGIHLDLPAPGAEEDAVSEASADTLPAEGGASDAEMEPPAAAAEAEEIFVPEEVPAAENPLLAALGLLPPRDGGRYKIKVGAATLALKKRGNSLTLGAAAGAAEELIFECRHITEGKHAGTMEFCVAEGAYAGRFLDKWYRNNPKGRHEVKIYRAIDIMPQNPAQRWRVEKGAGGAMRLTPFCSPGMFLAINEAGVACCTEAGAAISFVPA